MAACKLCCAVTSLMNRLWFQTRLKLQAAACSRVSDLEAIFVFSDGSRAEERYELALAELATALWLNNKHRSV